MRKYAFFTTQRIQGFHMILTVRTVIVLNDLTVWHSEWTRWVKLKLCILRKWNVPGYTIAQTVCRRTLTAEDTLSVPFHHHSIPIHTVSCKYHYTIISHPFLLYPVSTFTPLLHTHFYCILSVPFHHNYIPISTVPCQYHSTIISYPFLLYPVSTIPPSLHNHFYCILSVTFHHYFTPISTVSCQYNSTIIS